MRSYKMMLDFYGMKIDSTGNIKRSDNYKNR